MSNNDIIKIELGELIEKKNEELSEELKTITPFSDDFDKTRENVLNIIEKSNVALEDFAELAKQSGHPKSYEALAALIKTSLEANKTLLDLHQTSKRVTAEGKGSKGGNITNNGNTNIIMVGTTKDVLAMLKKKKMYNGNLNLKKCNVNQEWTLEQIKEYKKCQKSAKYFIEKYVKIVHVDHGWINFILRPFQKRMLESIIANRFTICKVPRQSGKSILVVGLLLWYVLFHENCSVALLAQKGEQAQELLGRLQLSYEALPVWMQQGVLEWNKRSIKLENGSDIIAASTSSGNIRGKTKNIVYLDEFAHVPKHIQEEFFASVYPTISSGDSTKMIITSTPLGLNMFYKIWVDSENGRNSYHRVEAHWSEIPGRDEKWKQETIKNTSERQFNQEFNTEFLGSSDTLIDGATLRRLVHAEPVSQSNHLKVYEKPQPGVVYSMMVDVAEGNNNDCSAFVVYNMSVTPYTVAAVYKNNTISPLVFPNVIEEVAKRYNKAYVLIETNNVGQQVADILFRDIEYEFVLMTAPNGKDGIKISSGFGSGAKVGIRTTKQTKRVGCSNLKTLVEDDRLILKDFDIIYELSRFSLQSGSYKAEDGYDDLAMCGVLFAWFQQQQFAKDLTNTDMRAELYRRNLEAIESDVIPVGEYNDGNDISHDEVVDLVNNDFDRFFMDDYQPLENPKS